MLTVLATDRYNAKAFFSNYGRNRVDMGAPGIHTLSTGRYLAAVPRYAEYSGTSAAAAYVSAGAALVFALNPGWQARDVVRHLRRSADRIPQLRGACVGGRRLNLARAVYGPLSVTAPAAGAVLPVGMVTNITWALSYNNPAFTQVTIEFVEQPGGAQFPITAAPVPITPGVFAWQPNLGPLPPLPVVGTVRITPVGGNFPAQSDPIQLV